MGNDNRLVLIALKIVEICGSALCLGIHVYNYMLKDEPTRHVTIFGGVYFSFFMVSIGFCFSQCTDTRVSKGLDVFYGGLAAMLYFSCAMFTMYYVQIDPHMKKLNDKEQMSHPMFLASICECCSAFFVGLVYTFDCVIAYDSWRESLKKKQVKPDDSAHRGSLTLEEDMGELNLQCYCRHALLWCLGKCRKQEEPPRIEERRVAGPATKPPTPRPPSSESAKKNVTVPTIEINEEPSPKKAMLTTDPPDSTKGRTANQAQQLKPPLMKPQTRIEQDSQERQADNIPLQQYAVEIPPTNIFFFSVDEGKRWAETEEYNEQVDIKRTVSERAMDLSPES